MSASLIFRGAALEGGYLIGEAIYQILWYLFGKHRYLYFLFFCANKHPEMLIRKTPVETFLKPPGGALGFIWGGMFVSSFSCCYSD